MRCAKRLQADALHRLRQPHRPGAQSHRQGFDLGVGGRDGFDRPDHVRSIAHPPWFFKSLPSSRFFHPSLNPGGGTTSRSGSTVKPVRQAATTGCTNRTSAGMPERSNPHRRGALTLVACVLPSSFESLLAGLAFGMTAREGSAV